MAHSLRRAGGNTRTPPERCRDETQMDADLHFPLHIKRLFDELRVEYPEKFGDHEAYVISGARVGKPPARFYFDERSGLLERIVRYSDSPLGVVPTQVDFDDYRSVDGVETPFRRTVAQPGAISTFQVEHIQQKCSDR
jgi:hypothetical protein